MTARYTDFTDFLKRPWRRLPTKTTECAKFVVLEHVTYTFCSGRFSIFVAETLFQVNIYYYLEDNTVEVCCDISCHRDCYFINMGTVRVRSISHFLDQVTESKQENSGIAQGKLIKRHKIESPVSCKFHAELNKSANRF